MSGDSITTSKKTDLHDAKDEYRQSEPKPYYYDQENPAEDGVRPEEILNCHWPQHLG